MYLWMHAPAGTLHEKLYIPWPAWPVQMGSVVQPQHVAEQPQHWLRQACQEIP